MAEQREGALKEESIRKADAVRVAGKTKGTAGRSALLFCDNTERTQSQFHKKKRDNRIP